MAVKTKAIAPRPIAQTPDIFEALRRNVDRIFDDFGSFGSWPSWPARQEALFPRVDVTDTDGVIEVTAELPGLEEKDVDVSLSDGRLVISGEKKSETEKKEKDFVMAERSYGSFLREIAMPPGIETGAVSATMKKGVLTVKVKKPAAAQAKKIEVKAEA